MSPYMPFLCRYAGCGSRYPFIHNLREHDRMHSRIRPFRCRLCSHRSAYQGSILKHLRRRHFSSMTISSGESFIGKLCRHVEVDEEALDVEAVEMDQWVNSDECKNLIRDSDAAGFGESKNGGDNESKNENQLALPGNCLRVYTQLQEFQKNQQQNPQQQQQQQHHQKFSNGRQLIQLKNSPQKQFQNQQTQQLQQSPNLKSALKITTLEPPIKKIKVFGGVGSGDLNSRRISDEKPLLYEIKQNQNRAAIAAAIVAAHRNQNATLKQEAPTTISGGLKTEMMKSSETVAVNANQVRQIITAANCRRNQSPVKSISSVSSSNEIIVIDDDEDDDGQQLKTPPPAPAKIKQTAQNGRNQTNFPAKVNKTDDDQKTNKVNLKVTIKKLDGKIEDQQQQNVTPTKAAKTTTQTENSKHTSDHFSPVKEKKEEEKDGNKVVNTIPLSSLLKNQSELDEILSKISRRSLICGPCGRGNFASFRDYCYHHRTHSGLKPYTCTFNDCSAAFNTKNSAKQHLLKTHSKQRRKMGVTGAVNSDLPFPECYIFEDAEMIEQEKAQLVAELTAGGDEKTNKTNS